MTVTILGAAPGWVTLANFGSVDADLDGWELEAPGGSYPLPGVTLPPGACVRVDGDDDLGVTELALINDAGRGVSATPQPVPAAVPPAVYGLDSRLAVEADDFHDIPNAGVGILCVVGNTVTVANFSPSPVWLDEWTLAGVQLEGPLGCGETARFQVKPNAVGSLLLLDLINEENELVDSVLYSPKSSSEPLIFDLDQRIAARERTITEEDAASLPRGATDASMDVPNGNPMERSFQTDRATTRTFGSFSEDPSSAPAERSFGSLAGGSTSKSDEFPDEELEAAENDARTSFVRTFPEDRVEMPKDEFDTFVGVDQEVVDVEVGEDGVVSRSLDGVEGYEDDFADDDDRDDDFQDAYDSEADQQAKELYPTVVPRSDTAKTGALNYSNADLSKTMPTKESSRQVGEYNTTGALELSDSGDAASWIKKAPDSPTDEASSAAFPVSTRSVDTSLFEQSTVDAKESKTIGLEEAKVVPPPLVTRDEDAGKQIEDSKVRAEVPAEEAEEPTVRTEVASRSIEEKLPTREVEMPTVEAEVASRSPEDKLPIEEAEKPSVQAEVESRSVEKLLEAPAVPVVVPAVADESKDETTTESAPSVDEKAPVPVAKQYDAAWIRNQSEDNTSSWITNRKAEPAEVETANVETRSYTPVAAFKDSWIRQKSEKSVVEQKESAPVEMRNAAPMSALKDSWIRQKSEKSVDDTSGKKESAPVEMRRVLPVSALKNSWIRSKSEKSVDEAPASREPVLPSAVPLASRFIPVEEEADGGDDIVNDATPVETFYDVPAKDVDVADKEVDDDIVEDARQVETFYDQNGAQHDDEVVYDDDEIVHDAKQVETFYDQKLGGVDEFDEDEDSEIIRDARKVETFYDKEDGGDEDYDENDPIVEGATNVDTFYSKAEFVDDRFDDEGDAGEVVVQDEDELIEDEFTTKPHEVYGDFSAEGEDADVRDEKYVEVEDTFEDARDKPREFVAPSDAIEDDADADSTNSYETRTATRAEAQSNVLARVAMWNQSVPSESDGKSLERYAPSPGGGGPSSAMPKVPSKIVPVISMGQISTGSAASAEERFPPIVGAKHVVPVVTEETMRAKWAQLRADSGLTRQHIERRSVARTAPPVPRLNASAPRWGIDGDGGGASGPPSFIVESMSAKWTDGDEEVVRDFDDTEPWLTDSVPRRSSRWWETKAGQAQAQGAQRPEVAGEAAGEKPPNKMVASLSAKWEAGPDEQRPGAEVEFLERPRQMVANLSEKWAKGMDTVEPPAKKRVNSNADSKLVEKMKAKWGNSN